jgi:hypothetical protein
VTQVIYDSCWYVIGFPITCTNNNAAMVRFGVTEYIGDLFVNSIEVGGWILLLYFSILWVYLNTRKNKTSAESCGCVREY